MGQPIIAQFTTQADTSGLETLKSGMQGVVDQTKTLSNAATTTSFNWEGMGRKMDRPLGRLAFAGIAEQMVGTTDGMVGVSKATVALEGGLHAVGNALLFVQPEFALLAIGLAAVITLFVKLSASSKENAENIKKEVEAQASQQKAYSDSAEVLKKAGVIDEQQVKILKDLAKASKEQIQAVKDRLVAEKNAIESTITYGKYEMESGMQGHFVALSTDEVAAAKQKLSDITKASTGLLDYETAQQTKAVQSYHDYNMSVADSYNTLKKLMDIRAQMNKGGATDEQKAQIDQQIKDWNTLGFTVQNASSAIIKNELAVADMERQLTGKISDEKRKQIQSEIQWFNATIQAENGVVQAQQQALSQMASDITKYTDAFSSAWEVSNGKIKFNSAKFLSGMIDDVANAFAGMLAIEAAKDIGMGNLPQAAVAIAEITAIKSAAAIASGLLGQGSSVSGGATSSSATASSNNGPVNSTQVMVNFQGASLSDPGAVAVIMKGITKQVVQNNGQLYSIGVTGNSTPPPGLLA